MQPLRNMLKMSLIFCQDQDFHRIHCKVMLLQSSSHILRIKVNEMPLQIYFFGAVKLHFDESSLLNQPSFSTARKPLLLLLARIVMVMHSVDHIFLKHRLFLILFLQFTLGTAPSLLQSSALCSGEDFYHDKP